MVSCESKIVKILLGVVNLIWMMLGVVLMCAGIQLIIWNKDHSAATDLGKSNTMSVSIAILVIGILILLISCLGFFGACFENVKLLNIYAILMLLMIGAQIYAIVYSAKRKDEVEPLIRDAMLDGIANFSEASEAVEFLQQFQMDAECCGWNGTVDYAEILPDEYPASCCASEDYKEEVNATCDSQNLNFTEGCRAKLKFDEMAKYFKISIGVGIAIILFELVLIFAACCLAKDVR